MTDNYSVCPEHVLESDYKRDLKGYVVSSQLRILEKTGVSGKTTAQCQVTGNFHICLTSSSKLMSAFSFQIDMCYA